MKQKITYIKSLAVIVMFFCAMAFGYGQQTILAAGDIVVTGFNADDPDEFTFVLLTDVNATTEINFTDNGWFAIGGFRDNEGTVTWTADTDLICGTEIIIKDTGAIAINTYSASTGTAIETNGGFALAVTTGDQILAYQGLEATPSFIYAVNFDGAGWSDATSANDSALPTGLTDGTDAVDLGQTDNGSYACSVTSDQALILTAVSNNANWTLLNTVLTLGGCTYTCDVTCVGTTIWSNLGWSAGTPTSTTNAIIDFAYDTNANGNIRACSLIVNVGAKLTISDEDNGASNTYVEIVNDVTVDGEIVVNPKASFIQHNNNGIVNGNVLTVPNKIQVEKFTAPMNVWYEYTYWSSPVSDETIDNALSFADVNRRFSFNAQNFKDSCAETANNNNLVCDDGSGNSVQDDVDDNNDDWVLVTGGTTMTKGVGYASTHAEAGFIPPPGPFVPLQFKYIFEGPFNNGIITVPIYRNDEELADSNWNLIGNPYPSAIDVDLFLAVNTSIDDNTPSAPINGAIYLWSQDTPPSNANNGNQNSNFDTSDYAIINGTATSAGGDGLPPSRFIPSCQGFFVTMSDTAPSTVVSNGDPVIPGDIVTTDVTFNNSMRVKGTTDNSQFFRMAGEKLKNNTENKNKLWVNLTSDNGIFNQAVIGYVSGATNNYDGSYYDATRNLSTGTSAILYTNIDGSNKKFAIQGKAENSLNEDEVISLGFKTTIDVATIYTLSIAQLEGDFLTTNAIYVKDNLLNTLHNLKDGDYNFTSAVGKFNDRFEIVFNSEALSLNDSAIKDKALSIIELNNGEVQFKLSGNQTMKSIQIIDLQGRTVYNFKPNNNSETFNVSNLSQSAYIAKVELSDGYVITKKAIKRY